MNQTTIIGNLTRNPTLSNEKTVVCRFTVAVNREGERRETIFMPVVVFGHMAGNCFASLKKGTRVVVCGRAENVNDEFGTVQIVADHVAVSLQFDAATVYRRYSHEAETRRIAESLNMVWDGKNWRQRRVKL